MTRNANALKVIVFGLWFFGLWAIAMGAACEQRLSLGNKTSAHTSPPLKAPVFEPCTLEKHGTGFYGAQCAHITVPFLHNPPSHTSQSTFATTRYETLNVLRVPARSTPKNDPLVVITGGPGTSAVALAHQYLRFFGGIQKDRDIVFIDQRGTGKSAPLVCETLKTIDETLPALARTRAMHEALIECLDNSGFAPLNALNTPQAAADINAVRIALGYSTVNLWGSSYGTRVAMRYAQQFPNQTRTLILDGVAPASIALPRYAQQDASAALQKLFAACAKQTACHATFGNLTVVWQELLSQLAAKSQNITIKHLRTAEALTLNITPEEIANWVRFALYNQELSALLPMALSEASQGNFDQLAHLAQTASDGALTDLSYGMHAVILCREDHFAPALSRNNNPTTAQQNARPAMPFGELNDLSPVCQHLHSKHEARLKSHNALYDPITSNTPTLVLSGAMDPVTPPFWGQWASQNMTRSKHLIIESGHHGLSGLGCMPQVMANFVAQGQIEALDTQCLESLSPPQFFINSAGPALDSPRNNPQPSKQHGNNHDPEQNLKLPVLQEINQELYPELNSKLNPEPNPETRQLL